MQNHEETDGERAVKTNLKKLNIKFEQEKKITGLTGDTKKYRVADFYLPEEDTYVEFLGNWDTNEEHKKRYGHKRHVYEKNGLKCIWIYPNQLHYVSKVIKAGIAKNNGESTNQLAGNKSTSNYFYEKEYRDNVKGRFLEKTPDNGISSSNLNKRGENKDKSPYGVLEISLLVVVFFLIFNILNAVPLMEENSSIMDVFVLMLIGYGIYRLLKFLFGYEK